MVAFFNLHASQGVRLFNCLMAAFTYFLSSLCHICRLGLCFFFVFLHSTDVFKSAPLEDEGGIYSGERELVGF